MSNDKPEDVQKLRELAFMRPPSLLRVPNEVMKKSEEKDTRLLWAAPDQVEDHLAEGYEFVERANKSETQPDGTAALDNRVKSREMILMEISGETAREMEKALEYRTDLVTEAPQVRLEDMRDRLAHAAKQAGYSNREVSRILDMFEIRGSRDY